MFQSFTGYEYILIDIANQFGLDKLVFSERIQWVKDNITQLEALTPQAETKPLYIKAVMALRKAQQGIPTGHLVGFDSVCSGIQIMSALTGCVAGATATGLVDPTVRADAYTSLTKAMNEVLHSQGLQVTIPRAQAKDAFMKATYGSRAEPIAIFGEDTPELEAFYEAANIVAPGAWELLQDLLATWKPYALYHTWELPDGFNARVKVMQKKELRIEVDELDHSTFTYEYYDNEGSKFGLSNVANVVHSIDAYVLRSMHRRCNYEVGTLTRAMVYVMQELDSRLSYTGTFPTTNDKVNYYIDLFNRTNMTDPVVFPFITAVEAMAMPTAMLEQLKKIGLQMLEHKPFELVTVHDEFKCHANNMNHVRKHYIEILAQLAESNILSDILTQLHETPGTYTKLSHNLGDIIRESNYALC